MQNFFKVYVMNVSSFPIRILLKKTLCGGDDLILFFPGSIKELLDFHGYVNSLNENLKFSLEYDLQVTNFLDLPILKDNDNSCTLRQFSAMDWNTILHTNSFHPPWLIKNIPYGQIQRLRRICDPNDGFQTQSIDMHYHFRQRGYLTYTFTKAQSQERNRESKTHKRANSETLLCNTLQQRGSSDIYVYIYILGKIACC